MGKNMLVWVVVIVLIVLGYFAISDKDAELIVDDGEPKVTHDIDDVNMMMTMSDHMGGDEMMMKVDGEMMKMMMGMTYMHSGLLADVTEGKVVRGINTGGQSSGVAKANYENGKYDLLVTFENLPDPVGTDFYEGWIVRKGVNFSVISSGKVEKVDGVYTNTYASGKDLTDHDFYVLTLEPDDGDPAPADHILEGTLSK